MKAAQGLQYKVKKIKKIQEEELKKAAEVGTSDLQNHNTK